MKQAIVMGALLLCLSYSGQAFAAYYLEIDGVKGETSESSAPPRTIEATVVATTTPSTGIGVTAPTAEEEAKKGNVEYSWKVEEGEKTPGIEPDDIDASAEAPQEGVEPDEIDFMGDVSLMPDLAVLLGGTNETAEAARSEVANIVLEGLREGNAPTESLSLNYGKIKATTMHPLRLFGFIPVPARAEIEMDAEGRVKVQFPWWAFLAAGADREKLGEQFYTALSNVLKTKHDTIKNVINNIR